MINVHNSLKRVVVGLLLLAGLGMSHPALAHKLNLFAYVEGDSVSVEGYFADGRKTQNSAVKVLDGSGKVLVEGVTNDEGRYRFKIPQKSDLKIVLNAGMGHQGEFSLSAVELEAGDTTTPGASAVTADSGISQQSAPAVANSELETVVHRAVNEAIKPLVRELAESQQKASISEVVGAVGYIFGVLGMFAFYKSRQTVAKADPARKPEQG